MQTIPASSVRKWGTVGNAKAPFGISTVCPRCGEKVVFALSQHSDDIARLTIAAERLRAGLRFTLSGYMLTSVDGAAMRRQSSRRPFGPRPSVAEPRPHLLTAVLAFVRAARSSPGVLRIALVGSLATDKSVPKDADVLVTIDATMDLSALARLGRRLKGAANSINLGADIFLADAAGRYIGRICRYRECHTRVLCKAIHCGQRQHLNDDLQIVTLDSTLIRSPPIDLWPRIVRRVAVPADTEALLMAELEKDESLTDGNASEA